MSRMGSMDRMIRLPGLLRGDIVTVKGIPNQRERQGVVIRRYCYLPLRSYPFKSCSAQKRSFGVLIFDNASLNPRTSESSSMVTHLVLTSPSKARGRYSLV